MYIFKSLYSLYKSSESHALKAEPGEVNCIFYFRTEVQSTSSIMSYFISERRKLGLGESRNSEIPMTQSLLSQREFFEVPSVVELINNALRLIPDRC
jgi:hypothetical protein